MARVLVTGGAGFVGSHVVDRLVAGTDEVAVVDDLSTGKRENVNAAADLVCVSICSPELADVVARFRPAAVVHCAAQSSLARSMEDPLADAAVNILGTLNLLNCCRESRVQRVVYASSAAIYGQPACLPVTEDQPLAPLSAYGLSKLAGERYVVLLAREFGYTFAVLRYANVYGPRQPAVGEAGVVASFIGRLRRRLPPQVYGDGEQTRDFLYVGDAAQATVLAVRATGDLVLNVGTGVETSVNALLRTLQGMMRSGLAPERDPARPGDLRRSRLDSGQAQKILGWRPLVSLEDGLARTVAWCDES